MCEALGILTRYRNYRNAPDICRAIHRVIRDRTGVDDPYRRIKESAIKSALAVYPLVRRRVSEGGLHTALLAAAAGNSMDAAVGGDTTVDDGIARELDIGFVRSDFPDFLDRLHTARTLLIIGDNAGETVFDRLIAENLPGLSVTYAVRSRPIINDATEEDALRSAAKLMAQGGCHSVKLEGGQTMAPIIRRLVDVGIPVMGHLGYTPQSVHQIGLRVQGKDANRARQLLQDALAVQEAGAWAVVLELIPAALAQAITERLSIPTIGIGAGPYCSGEVQVWHDILGLYDDMVPRHTRQYATLADDIATALDEYANDVRERRFPTQANSSRIDEDVLAEALAAVDAPDGPLPSAASPVLKSGPGRRS